MHIESPERPTDRSKPIPPGAPERRVPVPRHPVDDHTEETAAVRRRFVAKNTVPDLAHVGSYSLDPASLPGNIENFTGVAQVPIGIAGPLRVLGEHAVAIFSYRWRRPKGPSLPATTGECAY
jgi:hypothetical protein